MTPHLGEIVGEVLGHPLGEGGHEDALLTLDPLPDLAQEIVHLALDRPHLDHRIDEPGRPDELLDDHAARLPELVVGGRGRDVDRLPDDRLELGETQRPVIERRRKPEPVLDEGPLPRLIPLEHAADLRHRDVRLIDHEQEVVGEVIDETGGPLAGRPRREVAGIVLDPRAVADLAQHLEVVLGARAEALRLEELPFALEGPEALGQLGIDPRDPVLEPGFGGDEVLGGIDCQPVDRAQGAAGHRVDDRDPIHGIAEHLDADRVLLVGGADLDHVAAHAEGAAPPVDVVSRVLDVHEAAEDLVPVEYLPVPEVEP